ncbi:PAS domain S-box-containing protein [Azospirillum fermentarium]|uniref:PAS domain-containing protein n=1 Tax=Azospirillum fermentarium TaxID=1233114 RepID=UPI002226D1F1|nr:PAS domain-containing protein [Azospirillum fermentarium]MCW2246750.1 PAS domain S-box-containing protein [Azospirillum fermentarium]
MARSTAAPTGRERTFDQSEIIVSKTDLKGVITYANDVFIRVSGFAEDELLGRPHSLIRHPDMPRCVFKLLWDRISSGHEIFAYVVNLAKNGDHYWVLAHVTPVYSGGTAVTGYHSSRRVPSRAAVTAATGLYAALRAEEAKHADRKAGMEAGGALLQSILREKGASYDEFVFSL